METGIELSLVGTRGKTRAQLANFPKGVEEGQWWVDGKAVGSKA